MPSEKPSDDLLLRTLHRPLDAFRSALTATIEQIRPQATAEDDAGAPEVGPGLGPFASGRIDAGRFAALAVAKAAAVEPDVRRRWKRAFDVLSALSARREALFRVAVPADGDLVRSVEDALAEIGRAYGAARVVDLARTGRFVETEHASWLASFPFARWNVAERELAPPLFVRVAGADCHAEGLVRFLDGGMKIVLEVGEPCPPAPLARLLTPGVYVLQAREPKDLEAFSNWDGPGIAALVPDGAARFVHDPDAGSEIADRLRLLFVPAERPTRTVGAASPFQQAEAVRWLRALAARPAAVAAAAPASGAAPAVPPADPVDRLAAWLLSQADLNGLE